MFAGTVSLVSEWIVVENHQIKCIESTWKQSCIYRKIKMRNFVSKCAAIESSYFELLITVNNHWPLQVTVFI